MKKYQCECIDCIGEWTGMYASVEELENDITKYCRSGKATFHLEEEFPTQPKANIK